MGRYAYLGDPAAAERPVCKAERRIFAKQPVRAKRCGLNRGIYENLTLGVNVRDDYFSLDRAGR